MELLQYTFFQHALIGSLLASICLRNYRYVHRHPEAGFYQRRTDACLFRRYRPGTVCGDFTDSVGSGLFRTVGIRRGMAQQAERHARGLCHCGILDTGNGIGHHIHIPVSRICTRPLRLPVREYPDYYILATSPCWVDWQHCSSCSSRFSCIR